MKKITIHPVSRIEGHAKITIHLDDAGQVTGTQFHVTQVRGFEKFTEGRPYYEMPSITARICGICPVSHLLASVKACDGIMAVRIPAAAAQLRELLHCAQIVQSHALSLLPPVRAGPAAGHGLPAGEAQRLWAARGAPRGPARRHRAPEVRPAGDRAAGEGADPPLVDRAGRRQRAARPPGAREVPRRAARGTRDREADARAVEEGPRGVPRRDRELQQLPDTLRRARRAGRLAAPLRRQPALRRAGRTRGRGPGRARRTTRATSARRRSPTPT